MLKKFISIFSATILCVALLSSSAVGVFADEKTELDSLPSKHMVLMDYNSGKVLYQKDADTKMYPASTTKIWTAFCVLKKADDVNEIIEIKDMPTVEGSSMYLENGEKFTVLELLQALLIHSSNDVAYVLARHYGDGNADNFIKYMNEEAKKYGALHTHFNNPHGLPDEEHYTTALDMTNLSRVAFGDETIKKIVSTKEVSFKKGDNCKLDRQMFNSNKFLACKQNMEYKGKEVPIKYDIVDGIKTGYTDDAGNCLVSTAQKNGVRLVAGVFGSPGGSLYHDSRALLDYGFDGFKVVTIFKKEDMKGEKKVKFSTPSSIKYSLANDYIITIPKNDNTSKKDYKTKLDFENLKMPVKKGDIIGTLNIFEDGDMVSSIGLVAENESKTYTQYMMSMLPFGNSKKEDPKKASSDKKISKDESKKTNKKDSDKKEKEAKDNENNNSKSSKETKDESKTSDKVKTEVSNSFNGFIGIFYGIGDFFKNIFSSDIVKTFESSNFYKFLDKQISSKISFIPSKVIILGIPIIIVLAVIMLIIGILRDSFKKNSDKKEKKSRKERKADKKARSERTSNRKSEMNVDDIVPKDLDSSAPDENIDNSKDRKSKKRKKLNTKEKSTSKSKASYKESTVDNSDSTKRIPVIKDSKDNK
ncbi:MAG: D-alanyl-D-alanine carboxypeptidase family protein [Peptostreptococcus sp.]|uniref:D-alanyl-D-alanine carboxypeptidase family protein n=1 Tax=Peptostreptococcus sp. TaxID=1262 RepID=UPI002FC5BC00